MTGEGYRLERERLRVPMSSDPMTMTIDPCPVLRVEYCMCESQRNASVKPWRAGRSESPYVTMSHRIGGNTIRRWRWSLNQDRRALATFLPITVKLIIARLFSCDCLFILRQGTMISGARLRTRCV